MIKFTAEIPSDEVGPEIKIEHTVGGEDLTLEELQQQFHYFVKALGYYPPTELDEEKDYDRTTERLCDVETSSVASWKPL